MRILVACEESQVVTTFLREKGYEAFSCDIQETSGNHPEWHIQKDLMEVLNDNWDAIIAFPPCTHLTSSGARWWKQKQQDGRQQSGIDFFMAIANSNCPRIAIENPVGIMSKKYRKPDQIIQPWMFGHGYTKTTCLWLKGFNKLIPTNIVNERKSYTHSIGECKDRAKIRSKTFLGIAKAMAEQWFGE